MSLLTYSFRQYNDSHLNQISQPIPQPFSTKPGRGANAPEHIDTQPTLDFSRDRQVRFLLNAKLGFTFVTPTFKEYNFKSIYSNNI